uniref:Uncharacterized protein n=1 Tax=Ascaris lumbricoides TaxID=6252 RepID=A0A9J2PD02_ASCLU
MAGVFDIELNDQNNGNRLGDEDMEEDNEYLDVECVGSLPTSICVLTVVLHTPYRLFRTVFASHRSSLDVPAQKLLPIDNGISLIYHPLIASDQSLLMVQRGGILSMAHSHLLIASFVA